VKSLLRMVMLLLVRLIGMPGTIATARQLRRKRTPPLSAPRILLIRPDHLGDLVMTTPILQALREALPQAHITMMVGPWSSEVVARHPAVDRLITCPFPGFRRGTQGPLDPYILLFRTAQQLRRNHYDLAINLRPDFWWGAALLYLACIPRRIGYAIMPGTPFLTHALPFTPPEHATVSNLRLVSAALQVIGNAPLAEPYTPDRYPQQFIPTPQERQVIIQRLQQAGIAEETPIAVIHPGSGAAVKLWRPEAWASCATRLSSSSTMPLRIVLTGSQKERPLLEAIAQGMPATVTPPLLLTDLTVGQLAAILAHAQLVLGVDSGPLHLAVAQQTPTIHIFGPTDARIFGPWGNPQRHRLIASTQRCPTCPVIPCGRLDFAPEELDAHLCVRLVTEQRVEQVWLSLLTENTVIR
jgi:ADP-heptose:LPS heptosyltransferase